MDLIKPFWYLIHVETESNSIINTDVTDDANTDD